MPTTVDPSGTFAPSGHLRQLDATASVQVIRAVSW